jgi:hypothetical protein
MSILVIAKYVLSLFVLISVNMMMLHRKIRISRIEVLFVLSFILILVHSIFFSSEIEKSIERSLFSISFILMLLSIRMAFEDRLLAFIKNVLIIYGVLIVIISDLLLLIFGKSSSFYVEGNFVGLSSNANTFGLLISVFLLPTVISALISRKRIDYKFILLSVYLLNLMYIMLETRSRAALGVLVVLLFTSILLKYKKTISRLIIGFVFILILIPVSILMQDSVLNKYENSSNLENSVFSTRMILWIHRIDGIKEKPLLGWGFQVNSAKDKFQGPHIFNELEKGNTPLALLEEFGIPFGMLIIILFYSLCFKFISLKIEYSIIPLIFIGASAHSMFETWLFNFNGYFAWLLWIIIFLGCSFLQRNKKPENYLNQRYENK